MDDDLYNSGMPAGGYGKPTVSVSMNPVYGDPYAAQVEVTKEQMRAAKKERAINKEMEYNKVNHGGQKAIHAIHKAMPYLDKKSLKKLIHLFSPGGAMNTFVILAALALGLAQIFSVLVIVGILAVGTGAATNSAIILYPLVGSMFVIGVILAAGLAGYTKEDGTLVLMLVTIILLGAASATCRVLVLIDTSTLTTSTCTGINYPEDVLKIFCSHYDSLTGNSYYSDPLVVWTNSEGRNDIVNAELCRNRSYLWYFYFINIGLFIVEIGLIAAVGTFVYYRKPDFNNVVDQFKGILILDQDSKQNKIDVLNDEDFEEL